MLIIKPAIPAMIQAVQIWVDCCHIEGKRVLVEENRKDISEQKKNWKEEKANHYWNEKTNSNKITSSFFKSPTQHSPTGKSQNRESL